MKKYYVTLIAIISFYSQSAAQKEKYKVSFEIIGGLDFLNYSADSLVPPLRKNRQGIGNFLYTNFYFSFRLKNPRFLLTAGLGYARHNFKMNKYGVLNIGRKDTFRLKQIQMRTEYINLPVRISYQLDPQRSRGHFYAGIQINTGFKINNKTKIKPDTAYFVPNSIETMQVENQYDATATSVFINVQPRIDADIKIANGFLIFFNLLPLSFNIAGPNKKLAPSFNCFTIQSGISYQW